MSKVLGLDLGTNSIGWAIIDTDTKQLESVGTRIFPSKAAAKRKKVSRLKSRKLFTIINLLHCVSLITLLLTLFDKSNWQFWLNTSLTAFVATLTLLHQDKK